MKLIWICFGVIVDDPRSVIGSRCFVLKFRLNQIYSFGLLTAIYRGFCGHISPKWRHLSS